MKTIADFPYVEVEFTKAGEVAEQQEAAELVDFLSQGTITDLFAISHGWNNDMNEARMLYKEFFERVRDEINNDRPAGIGSRKFAVFGILWPSKKFADDELIPSGAASFAAPSADEKALKAQLDGLKGFFDHKDADALLEKAKQLVDKIKTNPAAARDFADLIRSLPGRLPSKSWSPVSTRASRSTRPSRAMRASPASTRATAPSCACCWPRRCGAWARSTPCWGR